MHFCTVTFSFPCSCKCGAHAARSVRSSYKSALCSFSVFISTGGTLLQVGLDSVRAVMRLYNCHYAPSWQALKEAVDSGVPRLDNNHSLKLDLPRQELKHSRRPFFSPCFACMMMFFARKNAFFKNNKILDPYNLTTSPKNTVSKTKLRSFCQKSASFWPFCIPFPNEILNLFGSTFCFENFQP